MHCEKFKSKLNTVLDERLNPQLDSSLQAHALRCDECAELLDLHVELLAGVRQLPSVAPRADFAFQVMAAYEAEAAAAEKSVVATPRRWSSKGLAGILAVAAALGLVVVSWEGSGPKLQATGGVPQMAQSPLEASANPTPFTVTHSAADLELHREWVTGLAQGIKPVTTSVYTALQTIWRTLPASELAHVIL